MAQGYQAFIPTPVLTPALLLAAGWKITTYEAGTVTPLTTYSDGELTSENTNPIIVNANGFYRCFVAAGVLIKFAVTDENDVPQEDYSVDNVNPMVDPSTPDPSVTAVPTGGIIAFAGSSAPTGFLLCDGSIVSRATYADLNTLFAADSYPYGAGNGTTTMGLPDLRGRFPLGKAASGTGNTLGGTLGALDHTHTGPSHTHGVTVTRDGWSQALNSPAVSGRVETGFAAGTGQFSSAYQAANDLSLTSAAGGTGNTGTANAPSLTINWIIKT